MVHRGGLFVLLVILLSGFSHGAQMGLGGVITFYSGVTAGPDLSGVAYGGGRLSLAASQSKGMEEDTEGVEAGE